ncbi:MAG: DUF1294 domain-containing protein [Burkholderiaceae bacterium]
MRTAAAVSGGWRTSDKTLHLWALACGWPGVLWAQQWLGHKTAKPTFIAVFWGGGAGQCGAARDMARAPAVVEGWLRRQSRVARRCTQAM